MIRNINLDELSQVLLIEMDTFSINQQYKNLHTLYENPNYVFLANFVDDKLVSYVIGVKLQDEFEIYKIATKKEFKRHGYASELIKDLSLKYKKIFLEVSSKNINAIKFYEKMGFKKLGERKNYYSDGSDAINYIHHCK